MYSGIDKKEIYSRLEDCVEKYKNANTLEKESMLLENVMVEVIALLALEKSSIES